MPLNEDKLDEVIKIPWIKMFESMENGLYYSFDEMAQKLIGNELQGEEAIKLYLNPEDRETGSLEYILPKVIVYVNDYSYVWSVLISLVAIGKLKIGTKDGVAYFSKT